MLSDVRTNNADKLLSIYEDDVHVIVRHKSGAEVEFGNTLLLAEQDDGLIVDWKLFRDQAPADSRLLQNSHKRIAANLGIDIKLIAGDPMRQKGFEHRDIHMGQSVLSHNLWVLARLKLARGQTQASRLMFLPSNKAISHVTDTIPTQKLLKFW